MEFIERVKYKDEIGIYKIVNLVNRKVYIGQTKESFQRRYWLHRWKLRNGNHDNSYLQRAWNKYGEDNFVFEVIEILPKDRMDEREKFWIAYYRKETGCYSIQDGGQPENLNFYISPEIRKKQGERNRERMLGKKLSEETKRKMSESRTGKRVKKKTDVITEEQAREIKKLLVEGKSTKEIQLKMNVPYRCINNILSNNAWSIVQVEGWEDFQVNRERHKGPKTKLPEEIEKMKTLYDEYKSYNKVGSLLNIDPKTVKKYLTQTSC